jgi:hypothetical protein
MERQRPSRRNAVTYPEKCNSCTPSSKAISSIMGCEEFAKGIIPKKCDKALQRNDGWAVRRIDGKKSDSTDESPGYTGKISRRISGYSKMR